MHKMIGLFVAAVALFWLTAWLVAQEEADKLPLAAHGVYGVGFQWVTFVDENRDSRELKTAIWYPALIPEGEREQAQLGGLTDAEPDTSGAPYPVIFYSHGYNGSPLEAAFFNGHLASQGFVVVGLDHQCGNAPTCLTDRP